MSPEQRRIGEHFKKMFEKKTRAQGAIEYLLIIGAAVIIAVIVIALMMGLAGQGTQATDDAEVESAYEGLMGIKDKYKGVMQVTLRFRTGTQEMDVPQFYASNMLEDVFDSEQVPGGTIVTIEDTDYTLEDEGWKNNGSPGGQVELESNSTISVTAEEDFDLVIEVVPGEEVIIIHDDDPVEPRITLISPGETSTSPVEFEFAVDNTDGSIASCSFTNDIENGQTDWGSFETGEINLSPDSVIFNDIIEWTMECYSSDPSELLDSISGTTTITTNNEFAGGTGTISDPYSIGNCTQLQNVDNNLSAHYKLTSNIDCSGVDFQPIGSLNDEFTGSFNGNNKTISNLSINLPDQINVGLFGVVKSVISPSIHGLTLENVYINGKESVGGVVGFAREIREIKDILVSGKINQDTTISWNVGGIIGEARQTTIKNASFIGEVNGKHNIGGIIGHSSNVIMDSCSSGENAKINGQFYVGGLVGYGDSLSVQQSKNLASIQAFMQDADDFSLKRSSGGLVGHLTGGNSSKVSQSFSLQNSPITNASCDGIESNNTFIGGLVGYLDNGVVIENSYVRTRVSAGAGCDASLNQYYNHIRVGGFAGYNNGVVKNSYSASLVEVDISGEITINGFFGFSQNQLGHTTSFFDSTVAQRSTVGENEVVPIYPKTTTEMLNASTYEGWDESVWTICGGSYPDLKWNKSECDIGSLFNGGSGTESDPYEINTCQQLQNVNHNAETLSAHYELTSNIDCSGFDFTPIGRRESGFSDNDYAGTEYTFSGSFDGREFNISNLEIDRMEDDLVGLFGNNSGVLENIRLDNFSFSGNRFVGGIAAMNRGFISKSYANGTITISSTPHSTGVTRAGIIAGYHYAGTISESIAEGTINRPRDSRIGGFVGSIETSAAASKNGYAQILNSYSNVSGSNLEGFIGDSTTNTNVSNCFSLTDYKFYISTCNQGFDCTFNVSTKTETEMKTPSTFSGWDTTKWTICDGAYPDLKWNKNSC